MLLLFLAAATVLAQQQGPGALVVSGTVANSMNGRQIPRALVTLKNLDPQGSSGWARADDSGRFTLKGMEPGSYIISAEQQGFFTDKRIAARQALVEVPGKDGAGNLLVRLTPFAAVTGQVLDVHSDPVRGAELRLLGWEYSHGQRILAVKALGVSDDQGNYRIASVKPGRFYLMAHNNVRNDWARFFANVGQDPHPDLIYRPLFYPDTTDFREAQQITVRPGDEQAVDFMFAPVPAVSIRGRVVNGLSGKPIPLATVSTSWTQFPATMAPITTKADSGGNFEVWGLSPGSYTLTTSFPDDGESYSDEEQLEVGRAGASAVQLAGLPAFEVAGHVRLEEGEDKKFPARGITAEFTAVNGKATSAFAITGKPPDLVFTGKLRPQTSYRVKMLHLPDDDYLESVLVAGADAGPGEVMINAKRTEIEFTISTQGGHIEGVVADSKNDPITGSLVLFVPEDQSNDPEAFLSARSDAKGHFAFRGVPPGNYRFLAWEGVEFDELMAQPEILQDEITKAQSLKVEKNGAYTIFPQPLSADLLP